MWEALIEIIRFRMPTIFVSGCRNNLIGPPGVKEFQMNGDYC